MVWTYLLVALCAFTGIAQAVDWDVITELDDYVNRPDPFYEWSEIDSYPEDGYTVHVLNMTSQKWMDETVLEEPIWWHYLIVCVPTAPLIQDAGFLHIGGGNSDDGPPNTSGGTMKRVGDFARNVGAVSAYLSTVPYQPIHFLGGNVTIPRVEDLIIGYTWGVYIEDPSPEPDPDIVVLLPMTKAAKKALDTIHEFTSQKYPGYNITKFLPTGFSKRGWTTWLLGCVDKRVFAMAPTVFDLLNFQANLEHHFRGLGGWSWAFIPYWVEGVSRYLYHPRVDTLAGFIDPISFNERLTMPKLLIAASADQFFPPDGNHYFWEQLTEPKLFQIWENDDHSLGDHRDQIAENVEAFFLATYRGEVLPTVTWTLSENATHGITTVQTNPSVISVSGWWANTTLATCEEARNWTCRRDFRIQDAQGATNITWYQNEVTQIGIDQYQVVMKKRDDFGYKGFFIEMFFEGPANYQYRFTTAINIIPNTFPYPKCETEEECQGRIV